MKPGKFLPFKVEYNKGELNYKEITFTPKQDNLYKFSTVPAPNSYLNITSAQEFYVNGLQSDNHEFGNFYRIKIFPLRQPQIGWKTDEAIKNFEYDFSLPTEPFCFYQINVDKEDGPVFYLELPLPSKERY